MGSRTFIVAVINAFRRFAVYADNGTWVAHRTDKTVILCFGKAFTAGIVITAGMFTTHKDISLTAIFIFIVYTIIYRTS